MKFLSIFDKYSQAENNITKSLIDLLKYSHRELRTDFVRFLGINVMDETDFTYGLQVGEKLPFSKRNFVLGIATNVSKRDEKEINVEDSRPDAAIISSEVNILIEVKIEKNKLNLGQMNNHRDNWFHENHIAEDHHFINWNDIYLHFDGQKKYYKNFCPVTHFLLCQFTLLCENQGLSKERTINYILSRFNDTPHVQEIILEIDGYLRKICDVVPQDRIRDCLGYKKNFGNRVSDKFFSSSHYKNGTFIIHIGTMEEKRGLILQEEVNRTLNIKFDRNEKKSHEAFIRMKDIKKFQQIRPFIDLAYNERT